MLLKRVISGFTALHGTCRFRRNHRPLTIENCGVKQTFTQAPQRVVTVGQHETELLLALGLEKTIAATSVWFGTLPPTLEDAGKTSPACG